MSMSNSLHAKPRHRKRKPAAASIPAPQRNSLHSTSSAPHATDMGLGSLALPQDIDVPLDMPTARPVSPSAFSGPAFSTFFDRGLLSKETVAALPYANTTPIQALTFEPILQGNDVLARAKTGTGKTVAFLLPAIERIITNAHASSAQASGQVPILVLSPTRELANQIAVEAQKLSAGRTQLVVHCLVGGTNIGTEVRKLKNSPTIHIIAATPGRLIDHLENNDLRSRLAGLKCLVIDEADRLLDQGFEPDLRRILSLLPDRKAVPRQTLFFSATMPPKAQELASTFLLPNSVQVSTVTEDEDSTHTHVRQEIAYVAPDDIFVGATQLFMRAFEDDPQAKIIAFFPTAREVGVFSSMLSVFVQQSGSDISVLEIHSRKSQSAREAALKAFRNGSRALLISSDVVARGIDVPDVTAVYQIGVPPNAEQYVHRIGRTARAGREGRAFLLLPQNESSVLKLSDMKKLPIVDAPDDLKILLDSNSDAMKSTRTAVMRALASVDEGLKGQAYAAWLGYRKGFLKTFRWDPRQLINNAAQFAFNVLGYQGDPNPTTGEARPDVPPPLLAKAAGMMGLRDYKDMLNVVRALPDRAGVGAGNGTGNAGGIGNDTRNVDAGGPWRGGQHEANRRSGDAVRPLDPGNANPGGGGTRPPHDTQQGGSFSNGFDGARRGQRGSGGRPHWEGRGSRSKRGGRGGARGPS